MTAALSHRESDDAYRGVVAVLNDRWRVIVCKDGIQWILQYRDGQRHGATRWAGSSYHRTRDALIRVSRARAGEISPAAMAILTALPERIEG